MLKKRRADLEEKQCVRVSLMIPCDHIPRSICYEIHETNGLYSIKALSCMG